MTEIDVPPRGSVELSARFLSLLDEDADLFTFQTFDDTGKSRELVRVLHGSLDELADRLTVLNEQGAGVFVTINATDLEGRKAENIQRVRAFFVDLDGAPLEPVLAAPITPHIVVESSPKRFHAYWRVVDCPLELFRPVQKALAAQFNGDPSVNDLPRIMRLPGFYHNKAEPFLTRIISDEPGEDTLVEFCTAFDIDPQEKPPAHHSAKPGVVSSAEGWKATVAKIVGRAAERTFKGGPRHNQSLGIGGDLARAGLPLNDKVVSYAVEVFHRLCRPTNTAGAIAFDPTTCADAVRHGYDQAVAAGQQGQPDSPSWSDPEPLPTSGDAAPYEFPAAALPPVLRYAAQEVSRFCHVPLASAATVGLSIAAAAIGKRARITERRGLSHWPALFFALITGSGERKSPVFSLLQHPLLDWLDNQTETYEAEKRRAESLNTAIDARIQGIKQAAKKAGTDVEAAAADIAVLDGQRIPTPPHPRMFTSNTTPEMLFRLMDAHDGAYAVLSGEGRDVIDNIMGRYQSEGRTGDSIYLAGISGDTITRDRIGSAENGPEERYIARPCLNVCIMVQPDKYFELAAHPSLRGSGAIARIWPVLLPSMAGTRFEAEDEPDLNEQPLSEFSNTIKVLLNAAPAAPIDVKLSPEAKEARRRLHNQIEAMMAGELADVKDIAAKATSQTVKLALVLYLLEHPTALNDGVANLASLASLDTWQRAEALGLFYLTEAVRAMRTAQDDTALQPARIVLDWIKRQELRVVTSTDLMQKSPRPRPKAREAERILDMLTDYNWLRPLNDPTKRKPVFEVNPALFSQISQFSQG